jgi:hypothetical protein
MERDRSDETAADDADTAATGPEVPPASQESPVDLAEEVVDPAAYAE